MAGWPPWKYWLMYPPATGQANAPPEYWLGGCTLVRRVVRVVVDGRLTVATRTAGRFVGFGVGIAFPRAPGMIRTWPMTSVSSVSWFVATMSAASTFFVFAMEASVSPAFTSTTRPLTGGITRTWPILRSFFDFSLFAHQMVIIETPVLPAIPVSVSPGRTLYVRSWSRPSSTVVSTTTGLRRVPSARNWPATSGAPAVCSWPRAMRPAVSSKPIPMSTPVPDPSFGPSTPVPP